MAAGTQAISRLTCRASNPARLQAGLDASCNHRYLPELLDAFSLPCLVFTAVQSARQQRQESMEATPPRALDISTCVCMGRSGSNPPLNFENQWKPHRWPLSQPVREQEGQQRERVHPKNKPTQGLEVGRVREQEGQQRVGGQLHQVAARVRQQQPAQDGLLEGCQRRRTTCVRQFMERVLQAVTFPRSP